MPFLLRRDAGRVGYDPRRRMTPTNAPTNKVCRGAGAAQMGGKAHSALRDCSPNDRRASARPRPFHRPQPSGNYPAACCRLRYRSGSRLRRAKRRRPRPERGVVGRFARLRVVRQSRRFADGALGRHGAPTIVGGNACRHTPAVRACPARGSPVRSNGGLAWTHGVRQPDRHGVPRVNAFLGCAEGPRLSGPGAAAPPWARPPSGAATSWPPPGGRPRARAL
jgi:hypothetical protein